MYGEHCFARAVGNSGESHSGYGPRDTGFGARGAPEEVGYTLGSYTTSGRGRRKVSIFTYVV